MNFLTNLQFGLKLWLVLCPTEPPYNFLGFFLMDIFYGNDFKNSILKEICHYKDLYQCYVTLIEQIFNFKKF